MTAAPRVSVLMSVYNGARYLREAVDSILGQTFGDFEFIIVDDGSSDETPAILDSYGDPRMVRLRNETNIGLTKSLNRGLEVARGEFVARQDADDFSGTHRIERQIQFLETAQNVAMVGSGHYEIDPDGRLLRSVIPFLGPSDIYDHLLYQSCFCHGSVLMSLQALRSVGCYRENLPVTQDRDLWIRLSDRYPLANLGELLYHLRVSADSVSSRRRRLQREIGAQLTREAIDRRARTNAGRVQSPLATGRAYFHLALHVLGEGNLDGTCENLQAALRANPKLDDDADYCEKVIVQRAFEMGDWKNIDIRTKSDASQGLQYLNLFFQVLPEHMRYLRGRHRQAMAELHAAYGFATFRASDRRSAREHFLHALSKEPGFLRNCGMWKTMFRCFLPASPSP